MARVEEDNSDNHGKYESKIVDEKELPGLVEDGWEILKELNNGKLVVRRELAKGSARGELA